MDVCNPGCFAGDALYQRVIVGEIGKATEPRAMLVGRRLVTVGPGGNVGGTVSQLGPAGKIDVDAGGTNHEIHVQPAFRRLQFDPPTSFSGGLHPPSPLETKIGVAGAAIVG